MKTLPVSILILTKNRSDLLKKNLASLTGQVKSNDEIIIIDNASTDHTKDVIRMFQRALPIRSYISHKQGFSALYNLAIQKAKNPLLIFFDDDCVAAPGFVDGHKNAHDTHPLGVIQGMTYSIPQGNVYVDMMADHYQNWLHLHTRADGTLTTFDNKNASLHKKLLDTYGAYEHSLGKGAEDIELGIRLVRQGVPIHLDPHIIAYHHERTTLRGVITQHLRFAATDANLAHSLPGEETITMLQMNKIRLHVDKAWKREKYYITHGKVAESLLLPFVYIILLYTRIYGYVTAK